MIRLAAILIACAGPVQACWCENTGSACDWLSTHTVFIGSVTVDSGEGRGVGPAKLLVEEVLNGSYRPGDEITVNTQAGSDCYRRLIKDRRYVIFANGAPTTKSVIVGACSSSFEVAGNESLLNALRDAANKSIGRIVGKIQLEGDLYSGATATNVGVGGVRVLATSAGARVETHTQADGQFEFPAVPQGIYHLTLPSGSVIEKRRHPEHDPIASPGLCGYQKLYVHAPDRMTAPGGNLDKGVTIRIPF